MSILAAKIPGARVLDLFAGVGGVGIEALSRGAASATFVDLEPGPVRDIRRNLSRTKLEGSARVVQADAFEFLARKPQPHDFVFCGPPQWHGLWSKATLALDASPNWLDRDGIAVVQCDPSEYEPLALRALRVSDQRRYGGVLLTFYRRSVGGDA